MTTIIQGSSATITVAEGGAIELNSDKSSVARVEILTGSGAGKVVTASHAGRRSYGPFAAGNVQISAISGSVDYEYPDIEFSLEPTWSDSTGTALVRPDGTSAPLAKFGETVIAFGDSMTMRLNGFSTVTALTRASNVVTATSSGHAVGTGTLIDINNADSDSYNVRDSVATWLSSNTFSYPSVGPDGSASAISGKVMLVTNRQTFSDDGFWVWLQSKLGGALTLVKNAGVASNSSADMLARVTADVLTYDSDWVFFQPGLYNDFNTQTGYSTYTAAQSIAVNAQILTALLNNGRKVLLVPPPALGTVGASTNKATVLQKYLAVMKWMELQASTLRDVYYASNVWKYSVNPLAVNGTSTSGAALSGLLASDSIHESARGAERKAQAIVDAIGGLLPRVDRLVTSLSDNYGADATNDNIWDFGPWAGGGTINAGGAGGTPTPVAGAGKAEIGAGLQVDTQTLAATYSLPARADGIGYDQQIVMTPTANNDYARIRALTAVSSSRFAAGNRLRAMCELTLAGVSGSSLRAINFTVTFSTSAMTGYVLLGTATAAASYIQSDGTFTLIGPDILVPSDSITSVDLRVQFLFAAAGTALTAKVGRMSLRKVSGLSSA